MLYEALAPVMLTVIGIFLAHYLSICLNALSSISDKIMLKSLEMLNDWDNMYVDVDSVTREEFSKYNSSLKIKSAELDALVDAFDSKRKILKVPYRKKIDYQNFLRVCSDDWHINSEESANNMIVISEEKCLQAKSKIIKQLKIIFRSLY